MVNVNIQPGDNTVTLGDTVCLENACGSIRFERDFLRSLDTIAGSLRFLTLNTGNTEILVETDTEDITYRLKIEPED